MLADALAAARKRIAKSKKLNENDTKATLIEPILAALGWDVLDTKEVVREHKAPRAKPVDYALLVMREPKLYVEAKALCSTREKGGASVHTAAQCRLIPCASVRIDHSPL